MIAIVGGGMVGASLAAALALEGQTVELFERAPVGQPASDDARVSALNSQTLAWLHRLGIRPEAHEFSSMHVLAQHSASELHWGEADEPLGALVINQQLQCVALAAAERAGVRITYGATLEYRDGLWVDGHLMACDLCVAADGARSQLRSQAGIALTPRDTGQNATFMRVSVDPAKTDTTAQVFLATGPLAFLPVAPDQAVLVWSRDLQADALPTDPQAIAQQAAAAFEYRYGDFQALGQATQVPLYDGHVSQYHTQGLVLVGDSAHQIHPLAGQGVNLGLADAASLTQAIASRGPTRAACAQYARERYWFNEGTRLAMRALQQGFAQKNAANTALLSLGMGVFSRSKILRLASQFLASGRYIRVL